MYWPLPPLAYLPLMIIWFGIDETAKLFLVSLGVFFPIYLNTFHGIRNVDPGLIEMARSYGLSGWPLYRDVILPAAAYTEKPGTYVNTEGRVQFAEKAVFAPGDAREDWTILRAMADALGVSVGFDSFDALRAAMAAASTGRFSSRTALLTMDRRSFDIVPKHPETRPVEMPAALATSTRPLPSIESRLEFVGFAT